MNTPSTRLAGPDLLRAVAILWVMLFHMRDLGLPFNPVARFGWMGVDLFFVLSGFLISTQLLRPYTRGERPSMQEFYRRRVFRILPAFTVVLALYFLVPAFREAPGISPLWHFLTFSENYLIDYANVQAFSHVWSLCVEEHFYLALPMLVLWTMRRPSFRKTLTIITGVLLFGILIRDWTWRHYVAPVISDDGGSVWLVWLEKIYYPSWCRLDGLLVGVTLGVIKTFRAAWWQRAMAHGHALALSGLAVAGSAIYLFLDHFSYAGAVIGFPLLSIGLGLLLASSVSHNGLASRFAIPGASTIAALAYSLYLTHKEIVHLDRIFLDRYVHDGGYGALLIYAVTCFAAAAVLYLAVERPFLLMRDRAIGSRAKAMVCSAG